MVVRNNVAIRIDDDARAKGALALQQLRSAVIVLRNAIASNINFDDRAHRLFRNLVKSLIGVTARVSVTDPGGVERSQGKARRVIDTRPKE